MKMPESFIKRIQPDPDGLDFDGLRKEGIRLAQEASGDVWTDYNLHDPGVTLLEAICYALTDLVYRTGFSVADYLSSEERKLDFKQQALYRPDEIFPCRPVTVDDYRRLILNAIHDADNVWIRSQAAQAGDLPGLYDIYVLLGERETSQYREAVGNRIPSEIARIYSANRNLCEDLSKVVVVGRIPYSVCGEIEIEGRKNPADILAEVYSKCAQYLSPKVSIQSHWDMYKNGMGLEDILSGTYTEYGYIPQDQLHPWCAHFSIPELTGIIDRVDGVRNVIGLSFVDSQGHATDTIDLGNKEPFLHAACLQFPASDEELGITLYKNGKTYSLMFRDVETEYNRMDYRHQALRRQKQGFDWIEAMLPKGAYRNLADYYSIQNHFPDVYGLNAFGVPHSAPPERKAQAMQLKAYLLFFEQIMANFLQNLEDIPKLFSVDEQLRRSYFHQTLRNDVIPRVEEVYQGDVEQIDKEVGALLASHDRFSDRRNRVLDYLLAINGEKLSQASLHQFASEDAVFEEERMQNKIAFLKDIVALNKNRAAAFDYLEASGSNTGSYGLKNRLTLLLGLNSVTREPLAEDAAESSKSRAAMHIVEHVLLRPSGASAYNTKIPDNFYSFRISIIFPSGPQRFANSEFRKLAEETVRMNCPAHIHADLFWLDAEQTHRFDTVHEAWLERKRAAEPNGGELDAAAEPLIRFLLDARELRNQ